jgi:two-component system, OmpR family, phosphate regulon response regulator PhoB
MVDSLKGKKILWVEDDKFLSDIIAKRFSGEGCILFHSVDGEEALAIAEKEKPDIVLLDILLSGLDGFQILERLKKNAGTASIPIIILSNLGQRTDIEKGKQLGANQFLIKATVTLDEIIAEVKKTLPA